MKQTIKLILLSLTMAIALSGCMRNVEKELRDAADKLNKNASMMMSESVRFDSVSVDADKRVLQYNVCYIYQAKDEVDTQLLDSEIPDVAAKLKQSIPDKLKNDNVTFIYNYRDRNGEEFHKITITPDMYK